MAERFSDVAYSLGVSFYKKYSHRYRCFKVGNPGYLGGIGPNYVKKASGRLGIAGWNARQFSASNPGVIVWEGNFGSAVKALRALAARDVPA